MRKQLFFYLLLQISINQIASAPKSWPYMKTHDIWSSSSTGNNTINAHNGNTQNILQSNIDFESKSHLGESRRKSKVINFFPPFSYNYEDCLAEDGRRTGICMNVYECRLQGGTSRGDCALGFGACCIFEVTCDGEISNNVTYFTSPQFPGLMPLDREQCTLTIKPVSDDISQIRLDFIHFSLSQPNRWTGHCEMDVFSLEGGSNPFKLCGLNSGQHIFYDIVRPNGRQFMDTTSPELKINITLNRRSLSTRLWEIRISQIPFSARSPTGCLQYFTGDEGIIQTFNFADNGRHLANQNYRSCIRQEAGKCSIQYEPCNDNSFRIGPMNSGMNGAQNPQGNPTLMDQMNVENPQDEMSPIDETDEMNQQGDNEIAEEETDEDMMPAPNDPSDMAENPPAEESQPPQDPPQDSQPEESQQQQQQDDPSQNDEEGSGGGGSSSFFPSFQFPSFFPSFTSRQGRQLYSLCTDRITMPCIMEDFIAAGMGDAPSCLPVHCGNTLCHNSASSQCRVETSVTPFHVGIHFGDGSGNKGSPEDNIGACLRYRQLPCT